MGIRPAREHGGLTFAGDAILFYY